MNGLERELMAEEESKRKRTVVVKEIMEMVDKISKTNFLNFHLDDNLMEHHRLISVFSV
jgi:hypothetical protein